MANLLQTIVNKPDLDVGDSERLYTRRPSSCGHVGRSQSTVLTLSSPSQAQPSVGHREAILASESNFRHSYGAHVAQAAREHQTPSPISTSAVKATFRGRGTSFCIHFSIHTGFPGESRRTMKVCIYSMILSHRLTAHSRTALSKMTVTAVPTIPHYEPAPPSQEDREFYFF